MWRREAPTTHGFPCITLMFALEQTSSETVPSARELMESVIPAFFCYVCNICMYVSETVPYCSLNQSGTNFKLNYIY